MRRASPYRIPADVEPEAHPRPASRARLATFKGAWAASLAAHAAVLGALALAPTPASAVLSPDPKQPQSAAHDLYVRAEDNRPAFPLPLWVQACFDRTELPAPHGCLRFDYDLPLSESEAFGYPAEAKEGWARIGLPDLVHHDLEGAAKLTVSAAGQCAEYASLAGWSGRGRVFVRVERREDSAAIVTTAPLDDGARYDAYDALLCCLRQAQAPLASTLRTGGAVRFVLVFGADPERPYYMDIEDTAASRGSGGDAALRALRRGFGG